MYLDHLYDYSSLYTNLCAHTMETRKGPTLSKEDDDRITVEDEDTSE